MVTTFIYFEQCQIVSEFFKYVLVSTVGIYHLCQWSFFSFLIAPRRYMVEEKITLFEQ